ncbi:hypothetical protein [Brachyspira catarrhinii]|uniref:hypothetical protein n=1 Tax=Brachyspira catarrhinii TaxID=2528966 RepID=UPI001386AAB3|nr:hypothetical protein [Brachyspira catarrhinii]
MLIKAEVYKDGKIIEKIFEKKLRLNKYISENIKDALCIKLYAIHGIKKIKKVKNRK